MFKPNFKYSNKIVKLLTKIYATREIILNSPLISKWSVNLRQEAIIHSAHSSTSIEGNRLSLEQVSELARGREIMAALILYLRGFDVNQFFCLDDYYDSDRPAYYKALQSVKPDILDLTNWLEYFVEGVNISIEAVKERILRLSSRRLQKAKGKQVALTERQMRIIEFINQNGKITNRDVREMFKLSDEGALKEIKKLTNLEIIKSEGKGRALQYILK
jgi:Fic family protein